MVQVHHSLLRITEGRKRGQAENDKGGAWGGDPFFFLGLELSTRGPIQFARHVKLT